MKGSTRRKMKKRRERERELEVDNHVNGCAICSGVVTLVDDDGISINQTCRQLVDLKVRK